MKIIFELDDQKDDAETIETMQNASKYRSILWNIDQQMRSALKYGEPKIDALLLERLRIMIGEAGF